MTEEQRNLLKTWKERADKGGLVVDFGNCQAVYVSDVEKLLAAKDVECKQRLKDSFI